MVAAPLHDVLLYVLWRRQHAPLEPWQQVMCARTNKEMGGVNSLDFQAKTEDEFVATESSNRCLMVEELHFWQGLNCLTAMIYLSPFESKL